MENLYKQKPQNKRHTYYIHAKFNLINWLSQMSKHRNNPIKWDFYFSHGSCEKPAALSSSANQFVFLVNSLLTFATAYHYVYAVAKEFYWQKNKFKTIICLLFTNAMNSSTQWVSFSIQKKFLYYSHS